MSALELRRVGDIRLRIWRDISPDLDSILHDIQKNQWEKKGHKVSLFEASEQLARKFRKLNNGNGF
jgi:hypothetical protein